MTPRGAAADRPGRGGRPGLPEVVHLPGPPHLGAGALVAVPGLGLSVDVASRALRRLSPAIGSMVLALPGYGAPAHPAMPLDPPALAVRLLDALAGPPAVLVGHSASCQIVAEAAARAPHRVRGLVLVGPTTDTRADGWPALVARWLRTAARERPWQVPVLVRDYRHTGLGTMRRAMDAARRHRVDRVVAAAGCPVLVVRGRHDRIAPADWAAHVAARGSPGRVVTLPAGAHMPPLTHPDLLAAEIARFLDGIPP